MQPVAPQGSVTPAQPRVGVSRSGRLGGNERGLPSMDASALEPGGDPGGRLAVFTIRAATPALQACPDARRIECTVLSCASRRTAGDPKRPVN
jgi:hypothetical protein